MVENNWILYKKQQPPQNKLIQIMMFNGSTTNCIIHGTTITFKGGNEGMKLNGRKPFSGKIKKWRLI